MLAELAEHRAHRSAVMWAVGLSAVILVVTGLLTRVTLNINASTIENPDLAVIILLEEHGVTDSTLLRDDGKKRHYLVETKEGNKLVILRDTGTWEIDIIEDLHATDSEDE